MTELIESSPGIQSDVQSLRICEADIFDSHAHNSSCDKLRIFSSFEHTGQPIKSCIGIGPSYRLMQSRNQIIMSIGCAIVEWIAALQQLRKFCSVDMFFRGAMLDIFYHIEKMAGISFR